METYIFSFIFIYQYLTSISFLFLFIFFFLCLFPLFGSFRSSQSVAVRYRFSSFPMFSTPTLSQRLSLVYYVT